MLLRRNRVLVIVRDSTLGGRPECCKEFFNRFINRFTEEDMGLASGFRAEGLRITESDLGSQFKNTS